MMVIRVLQVFVVAVLLGIPTKKVLAQVEATMPFMSSLPQITYYNPAVKPRYKFAFGLPSGFFQYSNNGFSYKDTGNRNGDSWVADATKLNRALKKKNYINLNFQLDLFRLSLKLNPRLYLTFNASAKGYSRMFLPKTIVGLLIEGNAGLIGQNIAIAPTGEALVYYDYNVGAGYTVNKKLDVGLRIKYLKGVMSATTKKASFDLLTNIEEIALKGDAEIYTSGYDQMKNNSNVKDVLPNKWSNNVGFAVDLGATYKINEKLVVGASILDLGSITWKNDVDKWVINPDSAQISFKGADLQKLINGEEKYFKELETSFDDNFELKKTNLSSYKTPLPLKMYFTARYYLRPNLTVNGLVFLEQFKGRLMSGISASVHREFGRRLGASISYTITNRSYNNLGLGMSLNLPPIQIFIVGDNLLRGGFGLIGKNLNNYVNSSRFFTIRTGMNFVLKWDKTIDQQNTSH